MSFNVRTLDLSTNSPFFALLSGREYQKDYNALPNQNLPRALRADLEKFYKFLTGQANLPLEENTFLIKAFEGVYTRIFGPVLKVGNSEIDGLKDNELYIQWGNNFIPLSTKPGVFLNYQGEEIDAEFGLYDFSGRGEDPALFITIGVPNSEDPAEDPDQLVMPIVVRFADWNSSIEPKVLNTLLKKSPHKLLEVIQKATKKANSTRVEATHEVDLKELELKEEYTVTGYYPCKTTYGISYRIYVRDYPEQGDIACGWANSSLRSLLAASPEITEEKPATLVIHSKNLTAQGKTTIRSSLYLSKQEQNQNDEELLNLDF